MTERDKPADDGGEFVGEETTIDELLRRSEDLRRILSRGAELFGEEMPPAGTPPAAAGVPPAPPAPAGAPHSVLRGRAGGAVSVLIADDNEDHRRMYSTYLRSFGWRTITARNGREAVKKAVHAPPDVIVLDLSMPVLDGWAAARELRAHPATRDIPLVALSAVPTAARSARTAGCDLFLAKPCLPHALRAAVELIVRDRAPRP